MTTCNKYVVKEMNKVVSDKELQDWLNELYEKERLELVAISDVVNYIFKRNAYLVSIKRKKNGNTKI